MNMVPVKSFIYIGGLVALAIVAGVVMAISNYDVRGYTLLLLALILLAVFVVIPRVAVGEGKLFLQFVILTFFLRVGASIFRILWSWDVKGGDADSAQYDEVARRVADNIWQWDFSLLISLMQTGTPFTSGMAGVVYTIIGPTLYGGFLFFTFLAFLGSCLYYRAFRLAFPNGNRWIFGGLIFLYPSWLYWPAGMGKDALMALFTGLIAYGGAWLICHGRMKGIIPLAVGMVGTVMIRPHFTTLLAIALGIALIFRPYRLGAATPIVRGVVLLIAIGMVWTVVIPAMSRVSLQEASFEAALARYEELQSEAARGGAAFEPPSITEPLGYPMAVITTLYRPFPWEAHRGAALILSLEGVFLLGFTFWRFGSIKRAIGSIRSEPYVLFILVYALLFIPVFSVVGNFSLLGRQRLQLLPLFFMLLAYPSSAEAKSAAQNKAVPEQPAEEPPVRLPASAHGRRR